MKTESVLKEITLPALSEEEQSKLMGGSDKPIIDDGEVPL